MLNMQIDQDNDSLLAFDSLIVKVYSKDSSFAEEVFHGVLRDPKQVSRIPMDPRVGKEYVISIIGYKGGKIGVNKSVTLLASGNYQSKELPIPIAKPETVVVVPGLPEILIPSDTSIAEGETLRFRVSVRNAWPGPTILSLKGALSGAVLDTAGSALGEGFFIWRPNFDQGRTEYYTLTFVYASAADKKVEKITRVQVLNVNRPPVIKPVPNQVVKENGSLDFKVEALDPDQDSVALTLDSLPTGAHFTTGNFTWKPTIGQSGNYFLTIRATDGKAKDTLKFTLTVGNVLPPPGKPVVKGKSPTDNKMPNWTWSSGGGGTGIYRFRLDNDDLSASNPIPDTSYTPPTELSEGIHALYVQEKNPDGIWSLSGRLSLVIDATLPGAPMVSVSAAITITPKPTWTWTPASGNGSRTYRYKLDDRDLMTGTTSTTTPKFTPTTALPEGSHTLYIQEQDSAGNWSAAGTASVTVDFTPPGIPKISSAQTSPTNVPKPTWNWTSAGNGKGLYRIGWKAGNYFDTLTSETYSGDIKLKDGEYDLFVSESDSAGNWSLDGHYQLTLDRTQPHVQIVSPNLPNCINALDPEFGGIAEDVNGVIEVTYAVASINKSGKAVLTGGSWSINGLTLPAGEHIVTIKATDIAGNSDTASVKIYKVPNVVFVRPGMAGNGTSWQNAYSDLQTAINSERGRKAGNEIWVTAGTYELKYYRAQSDLAPGIKLIGGFSRDGLKQSPFARSLDKDSTFISTLHAYGSLASPLTNLVVDGLAFKGENAFAKFEYAEGVIIRNCHFSGYSNGAAALHVGGSGKIEKCFFIENMRVGNGTVFGSKLTITDSEFRNNHSDDLSAGLSIFGDTCIVRRCIFVGNTKGSENKLSNIFVWSDDSKSQVDIDDCTIEGGRASINDGREFLSHPYVLYGKENRTFSTPLIKSGVGLRSR